MEEVSIAHEVRQTNNAELEKETERRLIKRGLIADGDSIRLHPAHRGMASDKRFVHFTVICTQSRQTFFLKTIKEIDNFLFCNHFLKGLGEKNKEYPYPEIIVPAFSFQGIHYYVTTYIEGQPLDTFPDTLPESVARHIADKLLARIEQLALLKAPQYSEQGTFVSGSCADILKKKIASRLRHPLLARYPPQKLDRAFHWFCEILNYSQFSQPTLIHMDIKPANIIYNVKTDLVSLIDFEFARFGDVDYGWTQILLSGHNQFNKFYKEQIIPHLTNNRVTFDAAFGIPKYQCYLFYQTLCNLIYYYDHHLACPKDFWEIFEHFIAKM